MCARCRRPVWNCAIENREHNGVWGGATERERQRIIRRRRRQRSLARSAAAS
ncbi:MAG: WhiB family transcriptional regulator [Microthrixaceae bacterium]